MAEGITSRDNETVKYACKIGQSRTFRQSEGYFLAEGLRLCAELCKLHSPFKVFYTSLLQAAHPEVRAFGGMQYEIAPHIAEKMGETRSPQGVFALFPLPQTSLRDIRKNGRYVVLENVQDPANVGAVLRSAAAFGFDGAVLAGAAADPFGGKALRASMGAAGSIQIIMAQDAAQAVQALRDQNIFVYAAALAGSCSLADVVPERDKGVALLIGNEGSGLTNQALSLADGAVRIPMTDRVESLNAAVAASVLLWHFRAGDAQ
ncbi:MAG: RNA methyltransferase [Ruthenibacterium sp.]